jgi:hypothetical protein
LQLRPAHVALVGVVHQHGAARSFYLSHPWIRSDVRDRWVGRVGRVAPPDEPSHVPGQAGEDLLGGRFRPHRDDNEPSPYGQISDCVGELIRTAVSGQGVDGRDRARGPIPLPNCSVAEVNLCVAYAAFCGSVRGEDPTVLTDLVDGPHVVVGPGEPGSHDHVLGRVDRGGRPDLPGPRVDPRQAVLRAHPDLALPKCDPPLVGQRESAQHPVSVGVDLHNFPRTANPDRIACKRGQDRNRLAGARRREET